MKRKNLLHKVAAIVFGGSLLAGQANAQERFFQKVNLDVGIASKYLAGKAGFIVEDEPVIQNYIGTKTRVGTFYEWSNTLANSGDVSEVDLGYISPSVSNESVGANFSVCGYAYPNTQERLRKWDLEAGINIFSNNLPLNLNLYCATSLTYGGDSSNVFKLTANKNFKFFGLDAGLEGALTYSDYYYSKDSGFSHATLRGELSKEITEGLSAYVSITGQKALNSFGGTIEDTTMALAGFRYSIK